MPPRRNGGECIRATSLGIAYTGQAGARAQDHAVKGNLTYRW